jgi:tRNA A37 threonylcarbamoyladenosine dehydratase
MLAGDLRRLEIEKMNNNNDRFSRTRLMLGQDGLEKLKNATITVVGLGAVGGYVVEGLARAGVGNLNLIDFDTVQPSNINRQIIALESTIGGKKTELLKQRVLDINPECNVKIKDIFVNDETIYEITEIPSDIVVDAIDSLSPKSSLLEALSNENINFVSAMGAARRTDPSAIKIGSLNQVRNCSLAKFVRKRLRRRDVNLNFKCVYSDELPKEALGDLQPNDDGGVGRQRRVMGSLPTITAIFGLVLANYVIQEITK